MKKIFSFLIFMFFLVNCILSQTPVFGAPYTNIDYSQNPDYYEIKESTIAYFQENPNPRQEKLFGRWMAFWESRVVEHEGVLGSFTPAMDFYEECLFEDNIATCDLGGNGGAWEALGPFSKESGLRGIGRLTAIWVSEDDPDFVLVGADAGGVWKTTNGTDTNPTWVNVSDNLRIPIIGVSKIIVDPKTSGENRVFYAGTRVRATAFDYGIGVIKSIDNGETWEPTSLCFLPDEYVITDDIVAHPDQLSNPDEFGETFFATSGNKLYKTTDGFTSTDNLTASFEAPSTAILMDVVFHPTNSNIMYLSSKDVSGDNEAQFYKSSNGGLSWAAIEIDVTWSTLHSDRIDIAVSAMEPDCIYFCIHYAIGKTIIVKSEDEGVSFLPPLFDGQVSGKDDFSNAIIQSFDVSDIYTNRIYLGCGISGNDGNPSFNLLKFRKTQSGNYSYDILFPYSSTKIHADQRQILVNNNGVNDIIYVVNDGGIAKHNQDGAPLDEWVDMTGSGLSIMQFYGMGMNITGDIYGGCSIDNGIDIYENGQWEDFLGGDGSDLLFDFRSPLLRPNDPRYPRYQQTFGEKIQIVRSGFFGTNLFNSVHGSSFSYSGIGSDKIAMNIRRKDASFYVSKGKINSQVINDLCSLPFTELISTIQVQIPTQDQMNRLTNFSDDPDISAVSNFDIFQAEDDIRYSDDDGIAAVLVRSDDMQKKVFYTRDFNQAPNATWTSVELSADADNSIYTDIVIHPTDPDKIFASVRGWDKEYKVIQYQREAQEGGDLWFKTNVSTGLPNVPVYCMEFQEGTEGVVYAGTEVGVYINENITDPNSEWRCYRDMPVCIVETLELNYCTREIYAASNGRGMFKAPLFESDSERRPIEIQGDLVWDGIKVFYNDVVLKSGSTLTIKKNDDPDVLSGVYFATDTRLSVEPGAKLIIDGGKLSTLCNDRWEGVEVWGQTFLAQTEDIQGYLEMKNDAIIEHANTGIKVFNPDALKGSRGGVILADDSKILNCERSVHFEKHFNFVPGLGIQNNKSRFSNCLFEVNDEALSGTFFEHARLYGVLGVRFYSCDFKDLRSDTDNISNLTRGIYSLDAGFSVLPICIGGDCDEDEDWKYSNFEGFLHGVEATSSGETSFTYTIDRSNFDNNRIGVVNRAVDNSATIRNNFQLDAPKWDANTIGLVINEATQFIVEENSFGANDPGSKKTKTGIVAISTTPSLPNPDQNTIYRNTFRNISIGNLSNGDNTGFSINERGLKYNCNNNQNVQQFDFAVPNDPSLNIPQGVSIRQGFISNPTGNKFSQLPPDDGSNFYNDLLNFEVDYIYYDGNIIENPNDDFVGLDKIFTGLENTCPSELEEDGVIIIDELPSDVKDGLEGNVNSRINQLDDLKSALNSLIDGGDTDQIISQINAATSFDADNLYANLSNIAPYVSKSSLKSVSDRTDIYTNDQIQSIIENNPDQIDNDLLDYVQQKEVPFDAEAIADLKESQGQITELTTKLNEQGELERLINHTIRFVLQNISQTGSLYDASAVQNWRNKLSNTNTALGEVSDQLTISSISATELSLDALATELSNDDLVYEGIDDIINIHINLYNNDLPLEEVSTNQLATLYNLADSELTTSSIWAQNILNYINGSDYEAFIFYPELAAQTNSLEKGEEEMLDLEQENYILARPNPAKDIVQFVYQLPEPYERAKIELRTINGQVIKTFIVNAKNGLLEYSTNDLPTGQYIFTLVSDGKMLQSKQLLIIK